MYNGTTETGRQGRHTQTPKAKHLSALGAIAALITTLALAPAAQTHLVVPVVGR